MVQSHHHCEIGKSLLIFQLNASVIITALMHDDGGIQLKCQQSFWS